MDNESQNHLSTPLFDIALIEYKNGTENARIPENINPNRTETRKWNRNRNRGNTSL